MIILIVLLYEDKTKLIKGVMQKGVFIMDKQTINEYDAREYIDNRKEYYIECGYDDEKAEGLSYCDLQEKYNVML